MAEGIVGAIESEPQKGDSTPAVMKVLVLLMMADLSWPQNILTSKKSTQSGLNTKIQDTNVMFLYQSSQSKFFITPKAETT